MAMIPMKRDKQLDNIEIIRRMKSTGKTMQEIACRLGISVSIVERLIAEMGLTKPRKRRAWQIEELKLVEDNCHLALSSLREKLRKAGFIRSPGVIAAKLYQLELGGFHEKGYSLNELPALLGHCESTIKKWIISEKLQTEKRRGIRNVSAATNEKEPFYWAITDKEIGKFLVQYPMEWHMSKIPHASQVWIIDMILEAGKKCVNDRKKS